MATLKDVAKETGLTVSTVSRVLNNRGYISEETRSKVHLAMKKLNYQPNEVARSLSKQTTNTLGVIVPHIDHPFFSRLISSLESTASAEGYKLLIFNSKDQEDKEAEYLEICKSNRVAGVILCSGSVDIDKFEGLNVPLVTIERFLEHGTASVECDNVQGGKLAAEHLIDCGCHSLIYLGGPSEVQMPADDRAQGFAEACSRAGVHHAEIKTDSGMYNQLEYHPFIEQVLEQYPKTDGIFASSDVIAAQVIQVCRKKGISIPKQLRLVGFDDVTIAALTTPSITTIHQPVKEMAQMAVSHLKKAGEGKLVPRRTALPVTLIKRETT